MMSLDEVSGGIRANERAARINEILLPRRLARGKDLFWLPAAIQEASRTIHLGVKEYYYQPGAAELREQLKKVAEVAAHLTTLLQASATFRHLALDSNQDFGPQLHHLLTVSLPALQERAHVAAGKVPRGSGTPKRWLTLRPEVLCALYLCRLWIKVRGKAPGVGSADAHEAADNLWLMSGGLPRGATGSLSGWRRTFEEVRDISGVYEAVFDEAIAAIEREAAVLRSG